MSPTPTSIDHFPHPTDFIDFLKILIFPILLVIRESFIVVQEDLFLGLLQLVLFIVDLRIS